MLGRLADGHILVTGGSKGIGAAIVEKCLKEEARVSFIDIDEAGGRALVCFHARHRVSRSAVVARLSSKGRRAVR